MIGLDVIILALLGYIAWRERAHALEREGRSSRDAFSFPALGRGKEKRRVRVISAEDDAAFNRFKEQSALEDIGPEGDDDESEEDD